MGKVDDTEKKRVWHAVKRNKYNFNIYTLIAMLSMGIPWRTINANDVTINGNTE